MFWKNAAEKIKLIRNKNNIAVTVTDFDFRLEHVVSYTQVKLLPTFKVY